MIAVGKGKECTTGVSRAHVNMPAPASMALPCCNSRGCGVLVILRQGLITISPAPEQAAHWRWWHCSPWRAEPDLPLKARESWPPVVPPWCRGGEGALCVPICAKKKKKKKETCTRLRNVEELAVTCRSPASQPSSRQVVHALWREPGLAWHQSP